MSKTASQKPRAQSGSEAFTFDSQPAYADKDEYLTKDLAFDIGSIVFEPGRGYDGANRWAVTITPHDRRGDEILTFSSNEKRDAQFKAAQEFLARKGPIRGVHLKKSGNAYYFENAHS